jgi:hypothetical protein
VEDASGDHVNHLLTALDDVVVIGLAAPELRPALLAEWESVNDATAVTLYYGVRRRAAGPFIAVRTSNLPASEEPTLQALLAAERDRLYDHGGMRESEPEQVDLGITQLLLEGARLSAPMRSEDRIWASRVELPASPGTLATVVSRGIAAPYIQLARVTDLTPLWAARSMGG